MSQIEQKLDELLAGIARIEKALGIVPDRDIVIEDIDSSISQYGTFATDKLKLQESTIENHKSAILGFLTYAKGQINKDTVASYLDSGESYSWKSNQLKALRRYIRDFLQLGKWIEGFDFSQVNAKLKEIPTDESLMEFINILPPQVQIVLLVLHNSGLRIGEVLDLKLSNIDFDTNMINASGIHSGTTKQSWISFVTPQTAKFLKQYIATNNITDPDSKLFAISDRAVQQAFKVASDKLGIAVNPHLLRTIFTEKCTMANIPSKYIDAFCGRISHGILAKHYTDYSPGKLREQYNKVEPLLILGHNS